MPQKKIRKFVAEREHKGESEMKNPNQNGKDLKNEMGTKIEEAAKSETRASPSNQDEEESEGTKELATEEEGGKLKTGLTISVQDEQQSKELEKAVAEKENESGDKNDNAAKLETKALPSIPDEEDSKGLKELATEKENKNGEKDEEAGKPKNAFTLSE